VSYATVRIDEVALSRHQSLLPSSSPSFSSLFYSFLLFWYQISLVYGCSLRATALVSCCLSVFSCWFWMNAWSSMRVTCAILVYHAFYLEPTSDRTATDTCYKSMDELETEGKKQREREKRKDKGTRRKRWDDHEATNYVLVWTGFRSENKPIDYEAKKELDYAINWREYLLSISPPFCTH